MRVLPWWGQLALAVSAVTAPAGRRRRRDGRAQAAATARHRREEPAPADVRRGDDLRAGSALRRGATRRRARDRVGAAAADAVPEHPRRGQDRRRGRAALDRVPSAVRDEPPSVRGVHEPSPTSFGEDARGELYVVTLAGVVYRVAR